MFNRPWHQLPIPLALLKLVKFRHELRQHNLHDTSQLPQRDASFGITHPGAVTLHNCTHFLRQLVKPNGEAFDLAAVDILRDRERGVPRYNRFRELIGRGRVNSFEEITSNPQGVKELKEVYENIENNSMVSVLKRHYPGLTPALRNMSNAFKPWQRVGPQRP